MGYQSFYARYVKRVLDFILSLIALIILLPVLVSVAGLVKVKLGSPVLFTQDRPGLNEKIFKMYKFRTMTNEKDEQGNLLADDVRLTTFGKFLRSTSLDELPELFNILKGDMSIVGPRPLLVKYLPLYNEEQKKRHLVRPGLTGLAQVSGRNAVDWPQRFDFDVVYIGTISFITDFRVILETIKVVINREGISSDTSATMEYFNGNETEIKK